MAYCYRAHIPGGMVSVVGDGAELVNTASMFSWSTASMKMVGVKE